MEIALSPLFFFFNDTATTEIYTLSLHDALPISRTSTAAPMRRWRARRRMTSTLSACPSRVGRLDADDESPSSFFPGQRKLKNAMECGLVHIGHHSGHHGPPRGGSPGSSGPMPCG